MRWLMILVAPLALAGCITEQGPALPMALAPTEAERSACLTYGDTPTFSECRPAEDAPAK